MINTAERVNIKNLVVEEPKTMLDSFVPEEQFTDKDVEEARKFLRSLTQLLYLFPQAN